MTSNEKIYRETGIIMTIFFLILILPFWLTVQQENVYPECRYYLQFTEAFEHELRHFPDRCKVIYGSK